ncbi:hypothetical protein PITCH_A1570001 [uncultured Desulfobacterium sp.]|uniref:Lipoprotein n=1 Tax=uncultured Desulfobacterium sp. TaxID=201089 RepID=A0A445MTR8_9BACT|nr:hypothetical protein PITCH_A1570001 [uncultured Desulfobacterium sp.]
MRISRCGLIMALIALVSGCTTNGKWIAFRLAKIEHEVTDSTQYLKDYRLGEVRASFIGQPIIKVKEFSSEATKITEAVSPGELTLGINWRTTNYKIFIKDGYKYSVTESAYLSQKEFVVVSISDPDQGKWGVLVTQDGRIKDDCVYSYDYQMMYYPGEKFSIPDTYRFNMLMIEKGLGRSDIGSYELIFSGKNDVSLNLTYREYTGNDLARPAFYQNLTYQPDAKQIRFKDFVIQIHDATNEKITYTVISDGL